MGIVTIKDMRTGPDELEERLGKWGADLWLKSQGHSRQRGEPVPRGQVGIF